MTPKRKPAAGWFPATGETFECDFNGGASLTNNAVATKPQCGSAGGAA